MRSVRDRWRPASRYDARKMRAVPVFVLIEVTRDRWRPASRYDARRMRAAFASGSFCSHPFSLLVFPEQTWYQDCMKKVLYRVLRPLLKPMFRHMTRNVTDEEIWSRTEEEIPARKFGVGSLHEWDWYLEGRSTVKVSSPREIVDWLRGCTYIGDKLLFQEDDFWQHPVTFEHMRKGDCEDHALWAWRKLKELGVPAEFVCGRAGPREALGNHAHAWIHLDLNGTRHLMETVAGSRTQMTYPLDQVRTRYCPAYSVDTDLKTWRYGGLEEFLRLQLETVDEDPATASQNTT